MSAPMLVAPFDEASPEARSSRALLGRVVLYGTFGLMLFSQLAFGAVEPWSIFVLEVGSALLFLLWVLWQASSRELRILGNPLFLPMLAFAALIAVQVFTGRTSYRYETLAHARLYCAYGLLCFLVVQSLRRTSQVRTLTQILCGYGFALAMFALIQSMSTNKLYWVRTPRLGGWIYGPYVNHNHYAGLMEMLIPIPLVVSLIQSVPTKRRILAGVCAAIMAATIFLSGSRGGMLAFSVEMAILAATLVKRHSSRRVALTLGLFLVVAAALLAWLGGEELTSRMATMFHSGARSELSVAMRLQVDRDGVQMVKLKPLLGWGFGTFPIIYPRYRSFYTNDFVNQAHDDYLQLLVEMGALGFAAMLWFIGVTYYRAIRKLGAWGKEPNGAVALAAMLGISGIMVHSLADFNLQIPANAALFYVLCVIAAMEPRFTAFGRLMVRRRHRPDPAGELSA